MSHLLECLRTRTPLNGATMQAAQVAYDNRAEPEVHEDERDPEAGADAAIELIGRACRALPRDKAAAADLLREAAALLVDIANEVAA